jgi:hypothetical protein
VWLGAGYIQYRPKSVSCSCKTFIYGVRSSDKALTLVLGMCVIVFYIRRI